MLRSTYYDMMLCTTWFVKFVLHFSAYFQIFNGIWHENVTMRKVNIEKSILRLSFGRYLATYVKKNNNNNIDNVKTYHGKNKIWKHWKHTPNLFLIIHIHVLVNLLSKKLIECHKMAAIVFKHRFLIHNYWFPDTSNVLMCQIIFIQSNP